MGSQHLDIAGQYYAGQFDYYTFAGSTGLSPAEFDARGLNFHEKYDDWYHDHFALRGDRVASLQAVVKHSIVTFLETYGHMNLAYMNCAISSGIKPHMDAVRRDHHTSDKLGDVIGGDEHLWNILDSAERSLGRAHHIKRLIPEMLLVTPAAYEGSQRAFHGPKGRKVTGSLAFDAADYMAFWFMVIDSCKGFVLDDIQLDMPELEQVMREIELARSGSLMARGLPPVQTSDWANSRNSILEMARGVYIRFGLHPLRPDAQMDMRLYDEGTKSFYSATLLDCIKPVMQNILRWAPQGIATEEAARTVARFINLHRMRTDPAYNMGQDVPLDLAQIDPVLAYPSQEEIKEFDALIEKFEPFLLQHCAHLIRPEGLPEAYTEAKAKAGIQVRHSGNYITNGPDVVKWQRSNIPAAAVSRLWPMTMPRLFTPDLALPQRPAIHGHYAPQRRKHSFRAEDEPFAPSGDEIWQDRPFDGLDEMSQALARSVMGVLETGIQPLDSPDYHAVFFDLDRGTLALRQAEAHRLANLELLPGVLGREFDEKVGAPNLEIAKRCVDRLRQGTFAEGDEPHSVAVFGTPLAETIADTITALRPDFVGPGSQTMGEDFKLALEMEMLRRNVTHITFQNDWQTSEKAARMMLQATKIEFGKVERPGHNATEIRVLGEDGKYISLWERYEALRGHLDKLLTDPKVQNYIAHRDSEALQNLGVRHISLALARLIAVYESFLPPHDQHGVFELQAPRHSDELKEGMAKIHDTYLRTKESIQKNWTWLWSDQDLDDILGREYRDSWSSAHGAIANNAGPFGTDDRGIAPPPYGS